MRHFAFTLAFSLITAGGFAAQKPVQQVCRGGASHLIGDGFRAINYIPNGNTVDVSPFVLLDHFSATEKGKGVGAHPHRGFETVTFVYDGEIAHKDSKGGSGVIRAGDIQWMTAGSGVLHQEYNNGETLNGVQLWVNLPAQDKMTQPRYQALVNESIPRKTLDDRGSFLRVVAGSYKGISGVAKTFSPVEIYDASLKAGTSFSVDLPVKHNTFLLVMGGAVVINGFQMASTKNLVRFGHEGETIQVRAVSDATVLIFSGEPLAGPVVQSGPFVMNTQAEIDQAYRDLEEGKFGSMNLMLADD